MQVGLISMQYLHDVINAINYFIEKKGSIIDTKRIRNYYKIKSSNRSKINFIWRFLDFLENNGYIELVHENPTKLYRIPQSKIEFKEVLNNYFKNPETELKKESEQK